MCPYYVPRYEEAQDVTNMIIGVIDVIVGIVIILSSGFIFTFNTLIILASFLYFLLSISSLVKNFLKRYFYDWRGYVNMISAISLILIYYGITLGIFKIFGMIIIIKGIISALIVLMKE